MFCGQRVFIKKTSLELVTRCVANPTGVPSAQPSVLRKQDIRKQNARKYELADASEFGLRFPRHADSSTTPSDQAANKSRDVGRGALLQSVPREDVPQLEEQVLVANELRGLQ